MARSWWNLWFLLMVVKIAFPLFLPEIKSSSFRTWWDECTQSLEFRVICIQDWQAHSHFTFSLMNPNGFGFYPQTCQWNHRVWCVNPNFCHLNHNGCICLLLMTCSFFPITSQVSPFIPWNNPPQLGEKYPFSGGLPSGVIKPGLLENPPAMLQCVSH